METGTEQITGHRTVAGAARDIADRLAAEAVPGATTDLGTGAPGVALALLHAYEAFGEEDHWRAAHALIGPSAAGHALTRPGLFGGTAGLVWVLTDFAERDPAYLPALRATVERFAESVVDRHARRSAGEPRLRDYDLYSGASGQLVTLARASRQVGAAGGDVVKEATLRLTRYLLWVADTGSGGVPNWLVPARSYSAPFLHKDFPDGLYDPGIAHGVAGLLAALCAVAGGSEEERRVRRTITSLAAWLARCRVNHSAGPAWPVLVRAAPGTRVPMLSPDETTGRAAWCHGAPGIADALLSAAAVCGRADIRSLAVAALDRVLRTPDAGRRVTEAGLCHGRAGLLAAFARAHRRTGLARYGRARDGLALELIGAVGQGPVESPKSRGPQGDGLLTGAAGVLLALVDAVSPDARWDEVLFLTAAS